MYTYVCTIYIYICLVGNNHTKSGPLFIYNSVINIVYIGDTQLCFSQLAKWDANPSSPWVIEMKLAMNL